MIHEFAKLDRVKVHPVAYPGQVYEGQIVRRIKRGYCVRVEVMGALFNESYDFAEVKAR